MLTFLCASLNSHVRYVPAGLRSLECGIHIGRHRPLGSSSRLLNLQAKVNVRHGPVHGARAQDINLYSHKMHQMVHCSARAGGPLTGDCTLVQALCNGTKLATIDVVEHDDISAGCDRFVALIFVSHLNVQAKRKATHFVAACHRRGDKPCAVAIRNREHGMMRVVPADQLWLSLSIITLERSNKCASIPCHTSLQVEARTKIIISVSDDVRPSAKNRYQALSCAYLRLSREAIALRQVLDVLRAVTR
jgi:hypothetical protein